MNAARLDPALAIAPLLDPVPAEGDVNPGWVAALLVVGLIVATTLLWFSMRKQLGKIRFREEPDTTDDGASPDARHENGA
ncbi:MAG TPA: hypothetical protein VFG72_17695 [Marmoricola sp.]|nr:hypothetical protein [Marmoricola sp.]